MKQRVKVLGRLRDANSLAFCKDSCQSALDSMKPFDVFADVLINKELAKYGLALEGLLD